MSPPTSQDPPAPTPATPRRIPTAKNGATITTPGEGRVGATPKSAPAAAGHASHRKKPEATLLADFLLGRPSPARKTAQRSASKQRRKSVALDAAGVREELRQEMRAAAVRRLQQPGGVHARVKAWQKANVNAMKTQGGGVPAAEDVASEPTEIAAQIEVQSVTEEDRVRIKLRQRVKKPTIKVDKPEEKPSTDGGKAPEAEEDPESREARRPPVTRSKSPPKKRIVSDDNWMKRNNPKGRSPPRAGGPSKRSPNSSPRPIPKDFLQRTARNPSPQDKVKKWAKGVEIPEPRRVKQYHHAKSGETITVEDDASSVAKPTTNTSDSSKAPTDDDGIRVKPIRTDKAKVERDDGIRVQPARSSEPSDDGIRVRPMRNTLPDDGIRIRPGPRVSAEEIKTRPASTKRPSVERSTRIPSARRDHSPSDFIEVIEESETEVATPTRRPRASQRKPKRRSPSPTVVTQTETSTDITQTETITDSRRTESDGFYTVSEHGKSDVSSSVPPTVLGGNKSLADIPFGYSAFSELDLPLGADARNSVKRPKAQRNSSFKAVPNVFKKVVSGAKDIIHDKVDPPKTVTPNHPPTIESWLNGTVDPFLEGPSKAQPAEKERTPEARKPSSPTPRQKERTQDTRKSSSPGLRQKDAAVAPAPKAPENQENADPRLDDSDATAKREKITITPTAGLKRSKATRSPSSPFKSSGKKPFREALKEAFRGQSGGHKLPPTVYPSCEADEDEESGYEDDDWESSITPRKQSPETRRSVSPDPSSTVESSLSSLSTDSGPPRRRPPPTRGVHALSTIISEASSGITESDTLSTISQTTVTQATAFTKSTELSRQRSQRPGLKRRLTKHSDLVSVLSLPDNGQLLPPSRSKSIKSSRTLHRRPSKLDKGKVDDLLDEFADDEHFYLRELKTLVDGVVPVLLKQVVNGDASSRAGLFDRADTGDKKTDPLAKSVVNMGVALEKLRNYHRRVPLSQIHHLFTWLEGVSSVYDNYLDVWRLGFQGLIVNLAPLDLDDDDSLINALPRNEEGDVLGENGERVDVAYLLKRPLIRIKWITKFLKASTVVVGPREVDDLLSIYESLQEKARKRHREEVARMTDEDASNTDTTRARDLRNLASLDGVVIDPSRQVAAKDLFSLDLDHSSGQRLECQVELVHRDKLSDPADKGDILIREIGNSSRSWLLFPPVPLEKISARRGDIGQELVVMIRGTHNGREWFELMKLSTDSDDQVTDWLDVLGTHPLPPTARPRATTPQRESTPPKPGHVDIPVGERRYLLQTPPAYGITDKPKTPSRYHQRQASAPSTPSASYSPGIPSDKSPAWEDHDQVRPLPEAPSQDESLPFREPTKSARPNSTPYREDGAPPPPVHRTLSQKAPTNLAPPADTPKGSRVKRRTSSPLKHEYHPSDVSSCSSGASDDESVSSDSSSDDLDEDDVPDTIPGYSIKKPDPSLATESVVSESSITPSNSASQVGARGSGDDEPEREGQKFVGSVSYWSNKKGIWKDISVEPTSIVVYPGCVEIRRLNEHGTKRASPLQSGGTSEVDNRYKDAGADMPLVSLVLTPVVMIRRSTALDLEVRSRASHDSRLKIDSDMFRFRAASQMESKDLYQAVHQSRLNNARYIQLSEEARVRSFGQQMNNEQGDGSGEGESSGRRGWFGRKNSYRASTRAPSISQNSSSTSISANSFLRRLTGGGNGSFNIDKSTVDKQSRPGSVAGGSGSLYTSSASSSGGGGSSTPPRSISISLSGSGQSQSRWSNGLAKPWSPEPGRPLEIRCHLNVQNNRWADKGDCILIITRPPPGVRQELTLYHGMEKRVIVTHATKKTGDKPMILLDAVLGSKCFSMLGARGIMCSVWENLRDEEGNVGVAPRNGALAGRVTKWCFQCKNSQQANWIMQMVTTEIPGLILN